MITAVTAITGKAQAKLVGLDGVQSASANIWEDASGARIFISAKLPKAGKYGVHLHAVGKCEGPEFVSAGPHWNPGGKLHGFDNPKGAHAGDLPNLVADKNGDAELTGDISGLKLDELLDADGAAIVIHEMPDDYKTDPSGNSGKRILCGVFNRI